MATNKRKDAAALFELIDRSTLKVPKNAGSLKIPEWWSSKSNPPSSPASSPRPKPIPTQPKASPTTPTTADALPQTPASSPATEPMPPEPEPAQARLFEPPPPEVTPATTPSFRPPSTSSTATPLTSNPVESPAALSDAHPEAPPQEIDTEATPPNLRPLPKVFAPQTYAKERKPWSPPRPGAFARLPAWVILSVLAGVVILVTLVIYAAKKSGASNDPAIVPPRNVSPATVATGGLLPTSTANGNTERPRPPGTTPTPLPLPAQETAAPGRILEAGTYPYAKEKFYVIICSTPERAIALRNAGWLTEKGIDVAIERTRLQNRIMYALVATRPFPSATTAESFRQEIVRIGDAHAKEAKDAFKTAYAHSNLTSPQPARTPAPKG